MSDPSTAVDIAVLFERLGVLGAQIEALSDKIDGQSAHRDKAISDLETRVAHIETTVTRARGFVAGIAAGGGVLGGVVSTMMAHWMSM